MPSGLIAISILLFCSSSFAQVDRIWLGHRSHDPGKDRERDAMTARAGYHTLRIPAGASPTVQTVLGFVGDLRDGAASAAYQG